MIFYGGFGAKIFFPLSLSRQLALEMMYMRCVILIPARYASTRLPGKPMADINGRPMVICVWERAVQANCGPVYVATDNQQIFDAVKAAGGKVVMTREDHPSGSDRIWEALQLAEQEEGAAFDVIINLQGDLPTIEPEAVKATLEPFEDGKVDIVTLAAPIHAEADKTNPAIVKPAVAWDESGLKGRALYFSRASIPANEGGLFHHIGIYAYRRTALERFVSLPPSPLELREKLEQLRALENGMVIDVVRVDTVPLGVDTQEQLEEARRLLA